jgi:hypothetical protein
MRMARERLEDRVVRIVDRIRPLLADELPEIQGAVITDLMAMWLAGHIAADAATTREVREAQLALHVEAVRGLIGPNEKMILARLKRHS